LAVFLVCCEVEGLFNPLNDQNLVLGFYLSNGLGIETSRIEGNLTRRQRAGEGAQQSPALIRATELTEEHWGNVWRTAATSSTATRTSERADDRNTLKRHPGCKDVGPSEPTLFGIACSRVFLIFPRSYS
jgi:hypothetical protein